jgi:NNP family nitrate/nitrite transporter-like MFS transporter
MSLGVIGVLYAIGIKDQPAGFWVFFGAFMWLFFWSGVGNASTFQMIPNIIRTDMVRLMPAADAGTRGRQSEMEAAAIVGFTSAIGAFGGFFIPKGFGASIDLTGSPQAALIAFLLFYASCVAVTWWFYSRRGSLLRPMGGASRPAGVAA